MQRPVNLCGHAVYASSELCLWLHFRGVCYWCYQADVDLYRNGSQKWKGETAGESKSSSCDTDLVDHECVKDTLSDLE